MLEGRMSSDPRGDGSRAIVVMMTIILGIIMYIISMTTRSVVMITIMVTPFVSTKLSSRDHKMTLV